MAHKSMHELNRSLEQAKTLVPTGGVFAHYKHPEQTYTVTGHAILEANDAVGIIYQANYQLGVSFVRSLASWLEHVDHNGTMVARFTHLQ
jgi:hypothetical protein